MSKKIKLFLFAFGLTLAISFNSIAYSQQAEAPEPGATEDAAKDGAKSNGTGATAGGGIKEAKQGVRFVFLSSPGNDAKIFLPLGSREVMELKISRGVPSNRLPFPTKRLVYLFDGDPYIKDSGAKELVKAQIPETMGRKVLCLVSPGKDKYTLEFVNEETELEIGAVYLSNLTKSEIGLRVQNAQQQDVETITLKPGEKKKFKPELHAVGSGKSNIYPTQFCLKDANGNWYVKSMTALEVSTFGALLVSYNVNEMGSHTTSTITVRPDRPDPKPERGGNAQRGNAQRGARGAEAGAGTPPRRPAPTSR